MRLSFVIDVDRCLGCQSCQVACKQENSIKVGINWRRVATILNQLNGHPRQYFLSIACNHCENPVCVQKCPTAAYEKTPEGIVLHNRDRCIGCRICTMACPYGSPQYNEDEGRVEKCDLCIDRLGVGLKPACVQTCPVGALTLQDIEALSPPDAVMDIEGFPHSSITSPSVRFKRPRVVETHTSNWDTASNG